MSARALDAALQCDDLAERIDRLYQMAIRAHQTASHYSLRAAALDGIRAEAEKQPGVVDWLRAKTCLALEPFEAGGFVTVMLRDGAYAPGGMRGAGAETVEKAAASALVDHLAHMVATAFAQDGA